MRCSECRERQKQAKTIRERGIVLKLPPAEVNRRKQAKHRANVTSRGNKAGAREKNQRLERFLALVAGGMTRTQAEVEVGVAHNTVDKWFERDHKSKARYQLAKAKANGEYEPPQAPFDAAFRERFFHHDTPPHMQMLIDVINEQVEIAEREQRRDKRVLILLPPEHGKSTLAVEEYLSYRVAMDPSFRGSIVCATQGKARKRLGAISRMLTDRGGYADLVDTYGPFRSEHRADSKPWTADYFMHLRAPASQRDYTCQALGWTGDIYGDRMDLIVFDDIATLKNQTPAEIEKMWEKTWGECRSRIRKGGLFLVIGTRMREADIYSVMEAKGFFSDKVIMPAIVREPGTDSEDDPGEALWEDGTSLAELLQLRKDDQRMFELMYQQNPLPSIGAVFNEEMIARCHDDKRYVGEIPDGCFIVAGIDPSVSNYTAGVVLGVKKNGARYLIDAWAEKGLTGEGGDFHAGVVEFITELCSKYRVKTLAVENNSWAKLINTSLSLRSKLHELNVRHLPVAIGPASGTPEEHAIAQLSGLFTKELISIPATPHSLAHLQPFFHQLLTWSAGKTHWRKQQDLLKAFRMAEWAAKDFLRGAQAVHQRVDEPGRPEYMGARKLKVSA